MQGKDISSLLNPVQDEVDDAIIQLSPKKSPKLIPYDELSEEFCKAQLLELNQIFDKHFKNCKSNQFGFANKKWPNVLEHVNTIQEKIGNKFEPKSNQNVHKFDPIEIDRRAEKYFPFVGELRNLKRHAIQTPTENNNCLLEAINMALNGHVVSQTYEIRLRAALYYAQHGLQIHAHGSRIGWAKSCGT